MVLLFSSSLLLICQIYDSGPFSTVIFTYLVKKTAQNIAMTLTLSGHPMAISKLDDSHGSLDKICNPLTEQNQRWVLHDKV